MNKKAELIERLKRQVEAGTLSKESFGQRTWFKDKFRSDYESNQVNGVWITEYTSYKQLGEAYSNKALIEEVDDNGRVVKPVTSGDCRQILSAQGFSADAGHGVIVVVKQ